MRTSLFVTMALFGAASADADFMTKWQEVQKEIEAEAKGVPTESNADFMQKWEGVKKTIEAEARVPVSDATPPTLEEMAAAQGFECESHKVHTEDGYILGVWRIPGKKSTENDSKLPVLLQHGIEADMMQWVYHKPEVAPAFVLARAGYDVWLGNNRGNRFSQAHETLDVKKKEFWHFTWEELGTKDTPAVMDYIIKTTGASKINYVGHSEGTTQVMAGASLLPEVYTEKVNHAAFLAPVTTFRGTSNKYMHFWATYGLGALQTVLELAGQYNLIPYGATTSGSAVKLCKMFDGKLCDTFSSIFINSDPSIDDHEAYVNMVNYTPSGAGYRNWIHYWQSIPLDAQKFQRFDYGGVQANIDRYGLAYAPQYEMSNLKFPISVFSGSDDLIAVPEDTVWTTAQYKDQIIFQKEYKLGHLSFLIAKDMSYFNDVMAVLNHANGVCDESIKNSAFELNNSACDDVASFLQ